MEKTIELINLLVKVLEAPEKKELFISPFKKIIWNEINFDEKDKWLDELFGTLAYDLDYYEPNEKCRAEDKSYYGDEKLTQTIISAFIELKKGRVKLPLKAESFL